MKLPDMKHEKIEFAKRFNLALSHRGIGTDDIVLATLKEILGIAASQLSKLKNGNAMPSIFTGHLISKKLKISYEWLMTGYGVMDGFQLQDADELALMLRYRSLTAKGKKKLIRAAFGEGCGQHERNPTNKTDRLEAKQTLLRLVSKDSR